jgi:phytoene dehydrogenase-like protein
MSARYDIAVIGGGLNGLTAAAYLARAGRTVVLFEASDCIGGSAATAEFAPGFRVDLMRHDAGHMPVGILRDLDLASHGLRIVSSNAEILSLGEDGSALRLDTRTPGEPGEALQRLSPRDAAAWPEFASRIAAIAGFLGLTYTAPMPGVDAAGLGEFATMARLGLKLRGLGKKHMVEVLRVLPMSVAEFVEDSIEHPLLRGLLASRGVMHTAQGPRSAGTAFVMMHHQIGRHAGAFRSHLRPLGGTGAIAHALAACARASGAEIRNNARVSRITMQSGRAAGVVLANGDEIAATQVVSAVSPRHTFLDLCHPAQLQPEFVRALRNIRYRGVSAKVNLAVDALPKFRGDTGDASGAPQRTRSIVIAPSIDYLEKGYDDSKYGRVSARPFLDIWVPTIDDPQLAPSGKHVMSIHVQYAPYKLRDAGEGQGPSGIRQWDAASREALGNHVVNTLAEYAPDLPRLIRHRQVFTPMDLEERFGLPEGNPYHGELALDQALFMRPVPAASRYQTPVEGLWLAGSGSHPGGAVPGQAGANAARQIQKHAK